MDRWTMHCDYPGCSASVTCEHEEPHKALLDTIAEAERLGWLVRRPVFGPLADYCPTHRSHAR